MAITPLPTAPNRIDGHETYVVDANAWVSALPAFGTEANALAVSVNADKVSSAASAAAASLSESSSASNANFEGAWSAGTYTLPSSVFYDSKMWQLVVASTTGIPGTSSDWAELNQGIRKNLLINPNFIVNQRNYVEGTTITVLGGVHDMWTPLSGGSITVSGESIAFGAGTLVSQTNSDMEAAYGKVATTSVTSGSVEVYDEDSSSYVTVTPSTPLTQTLVFDHVVKSTLGTTFSGLKLEVGITPTEYEIPHEATELVRCLYHFERILAPSTLFPFANGFIQSSTVAIGTLLYAKKAPLVTITSSGSFVISTFGSNPSGTLSFPKKGRDRARWAMSSTGYTGGYGCALVGDAGDEYIDIEAT